MKDSSSKNLTKTAMMAAIVFVGIYLIKIPVPNGYTHLGDCFIFLGVLLLGTKRGSLAGAIGAAASDVLGGYMHWAVPTFFIKYIMAFNSTRFYDERSIFGNRYTFIFSISFIPNNNFTC